MASNIDKMQAVLHYRKHQSTYDRIIGRLSRARRSYLMAPLADRLLRLEKAHSWAVISIQTRVEVHERAYKALWENGRPESHAQVLEALSGVNYKNNKADYIWEFLQDTENKQIIDSFIMDGDLDSAQKHIIDNVKGVSTVKAPFMLGNNGFVEKMCIDANVISLTGVPKPSTKVVEKYNELSTQVAEMFPELNRLLEPYVLQWVVFDYNRFKREGAAVSEHDVWFKSIGV